jgi:uncharacterized membrane protein YGL010W
MTTAKLQHLVAWQWKVYANAHQDRRNLLIHVVAVPLFAVGALGLLLGLLFLEGWPIALGVLGMVIGFFLQGIGHRYERHAPPPFASRGQFFLRILTEQFVIFPRFLLSGAWLRNVRAARSH